MSADAEQVLILAQWLEFFVTYAVLVVIPTLLRANWRRVWTETKMDIQLFYWTKIYPKLRSNHSDGRRV